MKHYKNPTPYLLFSLLLILIDQASKMLVHQYMEPGFSGQIPLIGDWLKLHYVLNPGMAFGMQLGHEYGKLFLTLFRLLAMVGIGWYLIHLARTGAPKSLLWALSLILAGAVGNVIDSTFYGVLLGNAPYGSPTPWFHGQVIDMIFVDFWEGFIPDWVPIWGGQYYSTPIFNIADSCIFIGVCSVLIFQNQMQPQQEPSSTLSDQDNPEEVSTQLTETDVSGEGPSTDIRTPDLEGHTDINKEEDNPSKQTPSQG
ncbi:lipoprotein signal peptidase [Dyadobacter tibetensis]|uniref:lipoprotein signal peptidase n=1 Tax=Dyadobacter tibetensis TaxID=1211851 RepID=UPI000471052E|nr:lipoprotein signal peptidase [Dyadobacter tibetensis]